jgi:DNA-binding response OmpR family regulator
MNSTTSPLNVLLVEDDENLNETIVDAFTERGYHVHSIDCSEALPELTDLLQLHLAIIDVNLPGESGLELVKRLRTVQPDVGLVILSARSTANERAEGYKSGADLYLVKPVSLQELHQALQALERRLWPDHNIPTAPDLKIDSTRYVVSAAERETSITQREHDLLHAWSRALQNILTHEQVAEVLGLDRNSNKQLMELQVSRLRKKLAAVYEEKQVIRSIRGQGYQLCASLEFH